MTFKKTVACFGLLFLLTLFVLPENRLWSQEKSGDSKTEELPNDVSLFKRLIGKWDSTTRVWSGKPGEPAIESTGVSEFRFVLNGQFLQEIHSGKMGEKEFRGIGYWGYDKHKKKFTRTWMDSLTSRSAISEGTLDQKLKALTYYGRLDDARTGQHDKMMRYELDLSDSKKILFKIYDLSIHKDAKVFECEYTLQEPKKNSKNSKNSNKKK